MGLRAAEDCRPIRPSSGRKEVNPMNIFGKKDNGQVEVPEIDVRGDEVTVQKTDDGQEQDRKVKLPKTKWF